MFGYICRFCTREATGYLDLAFNQKSVRVYVCHDCVNMLNSFSIYRCSYCGNIWMGVRDKQPTIEDCIICRKKEVDHV